MTETETPAKLEKLAFQFCKIATFSLLFSRFALPVAALLAAGLFLAAYVKGVRWSQCYFRMPLLIAGIWVCIFSLWLAGEFRWLPTWLTFWIHPR